MSRSAPPHATMGAMAAVTDLVLLEQSDGIAEVTLNRPAKLNALSARLLEALLDTLQRVAEDTAARVVILTGAGRAFSAGGDRDDPDDPWGVSVEADTALLRRLMESARLLREMRAVTVAAINGPCVGGAMAIACACDLRYAGTSARFTTGFAKVGLSGDFGGTWTLSRIVGPAKARELYLLSDVIDAAEAQRIGLVSEVTDDDELLPHARWQAERVAAATPGALVAIKQNLNDGLRLGFEELLDREAERQVLSTRDPEFEERFRLPGR